MTKPGWYMLITKAQSDKCLNYSLFGNYNVQLLTYVEVDMQLNKVVNFILTDMKRMPTGL